MLWRGRCIYYNKPASCSAISELFFRALDGVCIEGEVLYRLSKRNTPCLRIVVYRRGSSTNLESKSLRWWNVLGARSHAHFRIRCKIQLKMIRFLTSFFLSSNALTNVGRAYLGSNGPIVGMENLENSG